MVGFKSKRGLGTPNSKNTASGSGRKRYFYATGYPVAMLAILHFHLKISKFRNIITIIKK